MILRDPNNRIRDKLERQSEKQQVEFEGCTKREKNGIEEARLPYQRKEEVNPNSGRVDLRVLLLRRDGDDNDGGEDAGQEGRCVVAVAAVTRRPVCRR